MLNGRACFATASMSSAISASVQALRAIWRRRPNTQAVAEAVAEAVVARHRRVCESARAWGETEDISTDSPSLLSHRRKKKSRFLLLLLPHRQSARITPVPLLLTGVRHHPPGRTDKNLCADVSVPRARTHDEHRTGRVFPDHLITVSKAHLSGGVCGLGGRAGRVSCRVFRGSPSAARLLRVCVYKVLTSPRSSTRGKVALTRAT